MMCEVRGHHIAEATPRAACIYQKKRQFWINPETETLDKLPRLSYSLMPHLLPHLPHRAPASAPLNSQRKTASSVRIAANQVAATQGALTRAGILMMLAETAGNRTQTAKRLGCSRGALYRAMRRLNILRPVRRDLIAKQAAARALLARGLSARAVARELNASRQSIARWRGW